ncbi:MAG: sensor domain-containing diguanylate cyclase [Bryobacteraceae bacterium]
MIDEEHKRPQDLDNRLEAYAAWIEELRHGKNAPLPPTGAADPLAKLGRELQLLSDVITQRETELIRLFQLVHTVERGVLVEDVLDSIFERFVGIIPYDRIGCAFLSDGGAQLTAYWARSNMGPMQITKGYAQPIAESSLQEVLRAGQPRILNDLEAYLAAKPGSDSTSRIVAEGGRSSLTCPLFVDGRPLGVLFFTSRQKNAYGDVHQAVFRQIAEEIATVIDKSRLFQELVDSNKFLLRQAEQLKEVANRDALTGVLNRGAFMVTLDRQILASSAVGKTLGVIMIDIDHFKVVNDTYGHAAGDLVLREFTHRLSTILRQSDYLGRYGGEEFLLLIAETNADELLQIAERFRLAIAEKPFDVGAASRSITASFGLTLVSDSARRAEAAVAVADGALYAAKIGGRNRCVLA